MSDWRPSEQGWDVGGYEWESDVECECGNHYVAIDPVDGAEATCEECGRRYRLKITLEEADALPDWKPPPPRKPDGTLTALHVAEVLHYLAPPTLVFDRFMGKEPE